MAANHSQHPDVQDLVGYASGRIPHEQAHQISTHLADCETCADLFDKIPPDSAITILKAAEVKPPEILPRDGTSLIPEELRAQTEFEIIELIGFGGMGVVVKAKSRSRDPAAVEFVALKVIKESHLHQPEVLKRFQREAAVMLTLDHPRIAKVIDFKKIQESHVVVMEFIDGPNLAELVDTHKKRRASVEVAAACRWMIQVAEGLAYIHERNVVHRDIKPANVKVTANGDVKILDFGLVGYVNREHGQSLTTDQLLGTASYIAPEQARDPRRATTKADIYSLGCTLFFLLTGRAPFRGSSVMDTVSAHLTDPPPKLRAFRDDASPSLERLVLTLLSKDPASRPDADTAAKLLKAELESLGATPTMPRSPATSPGSAGRGSWQSSRWMWASGGLSLILALAISTVNYWSRQTKTNQLNPVVVPVVEPPLSVPATPLVVTAGPVASTSLISSFVGHQGLVWRLSFNPAGTRLASTGQDGKVRIWNASTGSHDRDVCVEPHRITSVAWSPDGKRVAAGVDRDVKVWDVDSGTLIATLTGHVDAVRCVDYSGDGTMIVSSGYDKTVRVWDLATGDAQFVFRGHKQYVFEVTFCADDKRVASGCWEGSLQVWDPKTGEVFYRFDEPNDGNVGTLARGRSEWEIVSGTHRGVVRFHDLVEKSCTDCWRSTAIGRVYGAETSIDRSFVAIGGDRQLFLRELSSGIEQVIDTAPKELALSVALSSDGRRMASGGRDGVIKLWGLGRR